MLATMINHDETKTSYLVVVIEENNLERMRQADPATLETKKSGGVLETPRYPESLHVMVAYEPDEVELYKASRAGGPALLHYLTRGYRFKKIDGTEKAFSMSVGREAEKVQGGQK